MKSSNALVAVRSRAVALIALLAAAHVVLAATQSGVPDAADALQSRIATQCISLQSQASSGSSDSDTVIPAREVMCECLPAEVKRIANENANGTVEEFTRKAKAAQNACVGKAMRRGLLNLCLKDSKATATLEERKEFCGCFDREVQRLSDDEIALSATEDYSRFKQRAAARAAGRPEPQFAPTPVGQLEASCRQKK